MKLHIKMTDHEWELLDECNTRIDSYPKLMMGSYGYVCGARPIIRAEALAVFVGRWPNADIF